MPLSLERDGRARFAVAPMIDWTDRHCRFFHRQLTSHALLHTEMVVADAVIHGDRDRLLRFDPAEHPVALQLGGSDPGKLAEAARIAADFGYDEINLNVGCPSDRVQSGTFGACMMKTPGLVGDCLSAMRGAVGVPVTVKCRIGVDDQDPEEALDRLADAAIEAGVPTIWVHARKAWLQGLSPKENREIPPLDYDRVHRLKRRLPAAFVGLNGGLATVRRAVPHLDRLDGVMMGRGAYHTPEELTLVDAALGHPAPAAVDWEGVVATMSDYAACHIERGGRLHHVARHMVGLFAGRPGARRWRQTLSEAGSRHDAQPALMREAMQHVDLNAPTRAAA